MIFYFLFYNITAKNLKTNFVSALIMIMYTKDSNARLSIMHSAQNVKNK